MVQVKICGLKSQSDIESAIESGADRIGLVLVQSSPRAVTFEQARAFAQFIHSAGREVWIVAGWRAGGGQNSEQPGGQVGEQPRGRFVDGLDRFVADTPEITAIQLHGHESAADLVDFRERVGARKIVKALGVDNPADLTGLDQYRAADAFLLDAKPPKGADREGGFGKPFDWTILKGFAPGKPWVLSGGLTPENVAEAIRVTGATEVDISSGVESAPGAKDAARVRAFIEAAKAAG